MGSQILIKYAGRISRFIPLWPRNLVALFNDAPLSGMRLKDV